jgi:Tfp pilus assembly protein PilF
MKQAFINGCVLACVMYGSMVTTVAAKPASVVAPSTVSRTKAVASPSVTKPSSPLQLQKSTRTTAEIQQRLVQAQQHLTAGHPLLAQSIFQELTRYDVRQVDAWIGLILACQQLQDRVCRDDALQQAQRYEPTNPTVIAYQTLIQPNSDRGQDETLLQETLQRFPQHMGVYYAWAMFLLEQARWADAAPVIDTLIQRQQGTMDDDVLRYQWGVTQYQLGNYAAAYSVWRQIQADYRQRDSLSAAQRERLAIMESFIQDVR